MAINPNGVLVDKNACRSRCSSKTSTLSSCRLIKTNFAGNESSFSSRTRRTNNIKDNIKSPYFTNDKVQLLSRITERALVNKKPIEFFSSFPLAASVYKANSDEFKLKKRGNKKVKKSVLTLPNEPVPIPKTYTVSDLNDSEYFNSSKDSRVNKPKKRRSVKRYKKPLLKERAMGFYNRDARYCSQLNIDLDCSSSEVVNYTGDGAKVSKLTYKSNNSEKSRNDPHDVWAVLKNINKLKFIPSVASQESVVPLRKRRPLIKKNSNRNDPHFIETCHTEEFSYISSFEIDSKTNGSCSPSSSFDRVTVIDKKSDPDEIMDQLAQNIFGSNLNLQDKIISNINKNIQRSNKQRSKIYNKNITNTKKIENNQPLPIKIQDKILQFREENVSNCNVGEAEVLSIPNPSGKLEDFHCANNQIIKENVTLLNATISPSRILVPSGVDKKVDNIKSLTKRPNIKINMMKPTGDSDKQLNRITKVTLSKGQEIVSSKLSEPQRKCRLALTLPNTNAPKLSHFEIKRRLTNLKFPIVILGKDQLTNQGIFVANADSPQFDGLDSHIWPFMLEWSEEKKSANVENNQRKETMKSKNPKVKHKLSHHHDIIAKMDHKKDLPDNNLMKKPAECRMKIKASTLTRANLSRQLTNKDSAQVTQKPKPLFFLKNKMLQFLHKSPRDISETDGSNNRQVETVHKDKIVSTNSEIIKDEISLHKDYSSNNVLLKEVRDKLVETSIIKKPYSSLRHPWAKGKWASDFIESIIKKIRSGVYYGVDRRENKYRINGTEIATQTERNASKNAYCQNAIDIDCTSTKLFKEDDTLRNIPGFDKTHTTLKIETIGTNKIAVKHCVTNVVVQFDIQVLGEAQNITQSKKSMSCIPINLSDDQEKVFKCNTSIINAILPAELCSIIPKIMQNILQEDKQLIQQPMTVENVQPYLISDSEHPRAETPPIMINSILSGSTISHKIRSVLCGRFPNAHSYKKTRADLFIPTNNMDSISVLCPTSNIQMLCHLNQSSVILHLHKNNVNTSFPIDQFHQNSFKSKNSCVALQLYEPRNHSIIPSSDVFNIIDFMKQIVYRFNVNTVTIRYNDLTCSIIIISRPLLLPRDETQNALSLPSKGKFGVISIFNAFNKNNQCATKGNNDAKSTINIDTISAKKEILCIKSNESKTELQKKPQPIKILRKKSYLRCYRKSNSMCSISSLKCTPLNRVTNLEEFCHILGCNLFSSVLEGCLEKKILGAVEEMKNWITDISPKQALLILLLTNKKDTPNLIRFRSVLLQGIAVNRITKSVELDTEIEVIEREHFNKLRGQCEGITYMPASKKNQNSLLEELYWIAKTTASDYHKTFDESSENLLKALLEKRKKLNPTYLRVMARYVGLGLLAPTKLIKK